MSKDFLLNPGDTFSHSANDYEELTRFNKNYIYHSADGRAHKFGYCTSCTLKVFWSQPKTGYEDHYFRHVKGYYTASEQTRMLSCDNYKPSKGVDGGPEPLTKVFLDEIYSFIKENGFWIFRYINAHILKDIGVMSTDFFISIIDDLFVKNVNNLSTADKILERTLPYRLLALMSQKRGNMEYTEIRAQTINFNDLKDTLKKEKGITSFDFLHFSLRPEYHDSGYMGLEIINIDPHTNRAECIHLIKIPIDTNALLIYIKDNKWQESDYLLSDEAIEKKYSSPKSTYKIGEKQRYFKIKDAMNRLLP